MSLANLIDEFLAALKAAGATKPFEGWAQFAPASAADLDALAAATGCELTDDLKAWLEHVPCELALSGNYSAHSVQRILEDIEATRQIDFTRHHANITSWNDGRFADQHLDDTYWKPQWVPIARDGCGNEYCVDLAPGPKGVRGQLIAMEFQDGQGPYLARWSNLEELLRAHLKLLADRKYTLDDEGSIEFDD